MLVVIAEYHISSTVTVILSLVFIESRESMDKSIIYKKQQFQS
jgi:hypothetical protein